MTGALACLSAQTRCYSKLTKNYRICLRQSRLFSQPYQCQLNPIVDGPATGKDSHIVNLQQIPQVPRDTHREFLVFVPTGDLRVSSSTANASPSDRVIPKQPLV